MENTLLHVSIYSTFKKNRIKTQQPHNQSAKRRIPAFRHWCATHIKHASTNATLQSNAHNTQARTYARTQRHLIQLPASPTVLMLGSCLLKYHLESCHFPNSFTLLQQVSAVSGGKTNGRHRRLEIEKKQKGKHILARTPMHAQTTLISLEGDSMLTRRREGRLIE